MVLSGEQRDAFDHVTGQRDLASVVGYAGSGKSAMLGVARDAWEREKAARDAKSLEEAIAAEARAKQAAADSEKAERAAKALGKKEAELVEVNVDTAYPNYPMPMMARAEMGMQAMDMKSAAPVASPGDSEITVTVSARAVLK